MLSAAVLIEATQRARVGHLVLCNLFRHPMLTARSLTSLDHLSGGRLVAGLGGGWTEREFTMIGMPFPDAPTRLRMLDEALRWATNVDEFKLRVQGISTTSDLSRDQMARSVVGGTSPEITRFGR